MSSPSPENESASPTVTRNNTVDAVVALLLFILGAVVVVEARRLGSGWGSDGPGAGYFPFYIGLILCLASAVIGWQALVSSKRDRRDFVNREQLNRVGSVLLPAVVYVFAIHFLGIYVASALYIALFMIVLGKYPVARSAIIGVLICAVFFLMFEVWFKVPLHKGSLEPLRFLGY